MREGSEGQAWDGDGMEVEKERGPVVTHGTGPTTRRRATRAQLVDSLIEQPELLVQAAGAEFGKKVLAGRILVEKVGGSRWRW